MSQVVYAKSPFAIRFRGDLNEKCPIFSNKDLSIFDNRLKWTVSEKYRQREPKKNGVFDDIQLGT